MVSNKMAKAGLNSWALFTQHTRDHKQVAQDIVDAAWHPFDADKPDTWPKGKIAPSGKMWACLDITGTIEAYGYSPTTGDSPENDMNAPESWEFIGVTHYCDPADISPAGGGGGGGGQ
jgi:hypothetical protein